MKDLGKNRYSDYLRENVMMMIYSNYQLLVILYIKTLRNIKIIGIWAESILILDWVELIPDSKVQRANMGPTWVLSAPWTLLSGMFFCNTYRQISNIRRAFVGN